MQINRLFEIVYLLLDKKRMTASELARHFEVSSRTIYRDIETLSGSGIPIYASKGAGGGISLTDNFILNKSVLSQDEQKSILSSLRGMNAVSPDEARPALEKLSAVFGGEQDDWIEADFSAWDTDNLISFRFSVLKDAIFTRSIIKFTYSGGNGVTELRTAEPVKLIFRGYDWYLLAWCRLREDFRFFKLTRMDELTPTGERFIRRPTSELRPPQPQKYGGEPVTLLISISPETAYRIRDDFPKAQWTTEKDGSFTVELDAPESDWLYGYLMTFGDLLRVIEPEWLKNELYRRLKSAAEQYEI